VPADYEALDYVAQRRVKSIIETYPLAEAAKAYERGASHTGFDERPTRTEHIWAWRRICQHISWLRSLRHLRVKLNLCRGPEDYTVAMRKRRRSRDSGLSGFAA
jgi:hypothetical protein